MKIIIVGFGKTGYSVAKTLSAEKSANITVIDIDSDVFTGKAESLDIRTVAGSGLYEKTLSEAGAKDADLIMTMTGEDEANILCCIMAKRLGTKHTAARVRKPEYAFEYAGFWKNLGIDAVINPELHAAKEISRLLRYQSADDIDTFIGDMIELVSLRVSETPDFFVGKQVSEVFNKSMGVLLAVVERDDNALIPNGDFVFEKSDIIRILGRPFEIMNFFTLIRGKPKKIQEVMIIGAGKITRYLTELLSTHTFRPNIKIIEKDREKCEALHEALSEFKSRCIVIHGDGANVNLLTSEEVDKTDAFICLTDRDEENAIISLYAMRMNVKKVITKVSRIDQSMIKSLGLNSVINPQSIASDFAVRYVKGLTGIRGNSIRMMHKIYGGSDGNVEAAEFRLSKDAKYLNMPIKDLKLKSGILFGSVFRNNEIIIPSGDTKLQKGDDVIIIAKSNDISDLDRVLF